MLKFFTVIVLAAAPALAAQKSTKVRQHVTKTGEYVAPHRRTVPNATKSDNYSTKGNVNPYTGKPGTRSAAPGPRSTMPGIKAPRSAPAVKLYPSTPHARSTRKPRN